MPDIEPTANPVSKNWPMSLGFYSREKKLIRDVSANSNKLR
jgi:hypothetical protein